MKSEDLAYIQTGLVDDTFQFEFDRVSHEDNESTAKLYSLTKHLV